MTPGERIINLLIETNLMTGWCLKRPHRHPVRLCFSPNAAEQLDTLISEILREHGVAIPDPLEEETHDQT